MQGKKFGGRKKGTPNKFKFDLVQACQKHKLDPFEVLACIAVGQLSCGTCFGTGRTKYKTSAEGISERICESCYGTLREKISTGERLKACEILGRKLVPDLRSVEITQEQTDGVTKMTLEQYLAFGAQLMNKVQ